MSDTYFGTDPWIGDVVQSHRRKARCEIWVDGRDVTNIMDPYLMSVRVIDGAAIPKCEIELDDRDARLDIPKWGARLEVRIGWAGEVLQRVFYGYVSDVESGFGRKQGGRRMWIYAITMRATYSYSTTPMQNYLGDGPTPGTEQGQLHSLQDALVKFGKAAGLTVKVHPILAAIMRDHWSQNNESFLHIGERLRKEFGATFRIVGGDVAEFSMPGQSVDGKSNGTVDAVWGKGLIAWRVHPWFARSTWGAANSQYFSTVLGGWKTVAQKFGFGLPWGLSKQNFRHPAPAPNSQQADQRNQGVKTGFFDGGGRIVINGEPSAVWMGYVDVKGARPGVDGVWIIENAEHRYSRAGYVTWLDVRVSSSVPAGRESIADAYKRAWTLTPEELEHLAGGDGGLIP